MPLSRKLRYGMVGGGPGAFVGKIHRKAAALDGFTTLAAGVFSTDPAKSRQHGEALHLDPARLYDSFEEMAEREAALPEDERIDFVSIVTPNFLHFPIAKAFIERGVHVVCEKPMTTTLEDAEELCRLVAAHDVVFALTHNYTGYPMVKQARAMVQNGELGEIHKVVVEYPQGWLATKLEDAGNKQAEWRTDSLRAGVSLSVGDIGSHAENLARYITGLEMESLCADIHTFVPGRTLEDDASMLIRYQGGARGVLHCSQISVGEENDFNIRVYGAAGALAWGQQNPNYLRFLSNDGPERVYKRGNPYLAEAARRNTRIPSGHPEAFLEAFANIYVNATHAIEAHRTGAEVDDITMDFPTVQDGAAGVHFIHTAIESGKERAWVDASYAPPG
ncbi:MAG: Gfo/Idh/MocA family oxidoreductase [Bacteroidetes bacterium SB0662_bin_6]|nr:Gfo/Idh/MocA family oxidoreductase [Bacteroidetes bacterium SB0668_bin_1]MYE05060.1 Gfo/Idh/MocA family oxidoreductase [Bacteroidetes bacterium SB0662_bin_6]